MFYTRCEIFQEDLDTELLQDTNAVEEKHFEQDHCTSLDNYLTMNADKYVMPLCSTVKMYLF